MAEVMVFHHAQGVTPGVAAFADTLREAGHRVHVPDLFGGRTFGSLAEGMSHVEEVGFGTVIELGKQAVENLPSELVYVGFSLGVVPAQMLAQTRPGAQGAILFYSCVPMREFGPTWPDGVPVQIHAMSGDPIFTGDGDFEAARELVEVAGEAELFMYSGNEHCFADSSLPSYNAAATEVALRRVKEFLASRRSD